MADLRLLIVEDDLPSLELMAQVFESLEAKVCPIQDSQEAAVLVDRERFDGIFLDLEMPNIRGLELTEKVRSSSWNKSTPVVVVTGRDDRQAMQEAFEIGATFYLQKPIDRQKLTMLFRTVRGTLFESRRRYSRIPFRTDVTCTTGQRTLRVESCNLSQGGVQLNAESLTAGESVRLSFPLPNSSSPIDVSGVVVWTEEQRRGIQFTKISPQSQAAIREYIASVDVPE